MSAKDILEVVLIPIALALIPIVWGLFTTNQRRRQFQRVIFRELSELTPHPRTRDEARAALAKEPTWPQHMGRMFVHREILSRQTENRDFILSLSPDVVYHVTQLWDALRTGQPSEWLHHLCRLEEAAPRKYRSGVTAGRQQWCRLLVEEYNVPLSEAEKRRYCGEYRSPPRVQT